MSNGNSYVSTGDPIDPVKTNVKSPWLKTYEKYSWFHVQSRFLEGKMLTIIDATFSDKEQREAQKSLVRNELRDWSNYVFHLLTGDMGNTVANSKE